MRSPSTQRLTKLDATVGAPRYCLRAPRSGMSIASPIMRGVRLQTGV